MARRSLATALFVDIVRSTERISTVGDMAWTGLLNRFHAESRREVHRFGGRLVQKTGDGFLATFDRPLPAIACANAIRDAVADLELTVRSGLHLGEIETSRGEVSGIGVHIAARVIAQARPGEVLVSRTVHDAVQGSGIEFEDRGEQPLKGLPGGWQLFAVSKVPTDTRATSSRRPIEELARTPAVAIGGMAFLALVVIGAFITLTRDAGPAGDLSPLSPPPPELRHQQVTFTGDAILPAISPDGAMIAYVRATAASDQRIMVQDLSGGSGIEIGRANSVFSLRWSPSGDAVLAAVNMEEGGRLLILPRLGGTPRRLSFIGSLIAWSPDGNRVASMNVGPRPIMLTSVSSGDTSLFSFPDSVTWAVGLDWSPRGDLLAVTTWAEPNHSALRVVGVDGKEAHTVVADSAWIMSPRWSASGDAIYYLRIEYWDSTNEPRQTDVMRIEIDPANGRAIGPPSTILSGVEIGCAMTTCSIDLSLDGSRLAYARDPAVSNLWVVTAGTGEEPKIKQITTGTAPKGAFSVSPDGRMIAASMGTPSEIHVLPVEGGDSRQVTVLGGGAHNPVWSPDGRRIAFVMRSRVWTIGTDGSDPRVFEKTRVSADTPYLTWAPGSEILYQSPGNRNFRRLDIESGQELPLIPTELEREGWMFDAKYSPGAERVAVTWNRDHETRVWIISLDSLRLERIGEEEVLGEPIGWSSDGRSIYVWDHASDVLRLTADHDSLEHVLTLPCGDRVQRLDMLPNGRGFICMGGATQSDIWIATILP